ncbi:MAG TPA: hypothetical protein V6D08_18545 [Candidatus Obscuribacterales bacterium]
MAFNQTGDTQLAVVEPSVEEDALVQRFIDASREIAPTVQVTLAKRIVRPGSNRVVCLAARTSVPLSDDEAASVSDLALRLSDGTNVVLSLSFFNDTEYSDCLSLARSEFNPQRYSVRSESRLGAVLVALAIIALSGFCLSASGTVTRLLQRERAAATAFHSSRTPQARTATVRIGKSWQRPRPAEAARSPRARGRTQSQSPSRAKPAVARSTRSKGAYSRRDAMLVPPPPPVVYTMPSGVPFDFYRFDFARSPVVTKPVVNPGLSGKIPGAKAERAALPAAGGGTSPERKASSGVGPAHEPKLSPYAKPPAARQDVSLFPIAAEPARASFSGNAILQGAPVPDQSPARTPATQAAASGTAGLRAPVPGDEGADVQLERLVMPAQLPQR